MFDQQQLEQQIREQHQFMNTVVAPILFTVTLACLAFNNARLALILAMPMVLAVFREAGRLYPRQLLELAAKLEQTKNHPHIIEILNQLERKYRGWRGLVIGCWGYFYSLIFYCFSMAFPDFFKALVGASL